MADPIYERLFCCACNAEVKPGAAGRVSSPTLTKLRVMSMMRMS